MPARRRRRHLAPLPPLSADDAERAKASALASMGCIDDLPAEVRAAMRRCEFLIDLQSIPRGFAWQKVGLVARIEAIKTFEDAAAFDRWLLNAGLRKPR